MERRSLKRTCKTISIGHRERFVQPPEVTFSQVFLSTATHRDHPEKDAQAVLAKLHGRPPTAEIVAELSTPSPSASSFQPIPKAGSQRASGKILLIESSIARREPGPAPSPRPMACIALGLGPREVSGTNAAARGGPKADRSRRDGRTSGGAPRARTGAVARSSRDPRRRPRRPVRARQDLGGEAMIRKRLRTALRQPAWKSRFSVPEIPEPNENGE